MPPPWKHQGFVGLGGGRACVPAEERVGFASLTPALLLEHYDVVWGSEGLEGKLCAGSAVCRSGAITRDVSVPAGREGRQRDCL